MNPPWQPGELVVFKDGTIKTFVGSRELRGFPKCLIQFVEGKHFSSCGYGLDSLLGSLSDRDAERYRTWCYDTGRTDRRDRW